MHDDEAIGFPHGVEDRVLVQGHEGARIDHLHGHAFPLEISRHLERPLHHHLRGDHRHVCSLPLDVGLPQRDDIVARGHLAPGGIEHLVLEEDDGVVVANGRGEEPLGVVGRGGRDDHEPRHVGEPRFEAL